MGRDLEEDFEDRKTSDSDNDVGDDDGIEEGVVALPGERDALRSRSVGDTPDAGRDSGWEAADGEMTDFRRAIASGIASPIVKQTWRTRTPSQYGLPLQEVGRKICTVQKVAILAPEVKLAGSFEIFDWDAVEVVSSTSRVFLEVEADISLGGGCWLARTSTNLNQT